MKIDSPNDRLTPFRKSVFIHYPTLMMVNNGFYPGIPTDFLQFKNHHPIIKKPEVLV